MTPTLSAPTTYDVTATWNQYGQPVRQHRFVQVQSGQSSFITFPQ